MRTAENSAIGLDNVVIAELLNDDANGVTYDTPIALKGAVNATANPNSSVETDYADNGAFFVVDNRGNLEINLELTNVAPDTLAKMLGQKRENGITVEGSQDQAPYFALGFRVWIGGVDDNGDKIYKLFWYAKGKFSCPEQGGETKQDNVSFQHQNIVAQFVSTIWSPDGNGGIFGCNCRTDYDTPTAIKNNWFDQPVLTTSADLSKLTVAIEEGTGKKIKVTPTKASGETTSISLASANANSVIVLDSDGDVVEGTFAVSGGTLLFTPAIAFSSSDVVTVTVTSGLKDVSGVGATPKTEEITIA